MEAEEVFRRLGWTPVDDDHDHGCRHQQVRDFLARLSFYLTAVHVSLNVEQTLKRIEKSFTLPLCAHSDSEILGELFFPIELTREKDNSTHYLSSCPHVLISLCWSARHHNPRAFYFLHRRLSFLLEVARTFASSESDSEDDDDSQNHQTEPTRWWGGNIFCPFDRFRLEDERPETLAQLKCSFIFAGPLERKEGSLWVDRLKSQALAPTVPPKMEKAINFREPWNPWGRFKNYLSLQTGPAYYSAYILTQSNVLEKEHYISIYNEIYLMDQEYVPRRFSQERVKPLAQISIYLLEKAAFLGHHRSFHEAISELKSVLRESKMTGPKTLEQDPVFQRIQSLYREAGERGDLDAWRDLGKFLSSCDFEVEAQQYFLKATSYAGPERLHTQQDFLSVMSIVFPDFSSSSITIVEK